MPAQAIIAPLSVQSFGGGATSGTPGLGAEARHRLADRAVGRDAAGDDDRLRGADPFAKQPEADAHPVLDHVDDRRLERGAEVGDVARLSAARSPARPAASRSSGPTARNRRSAGRAAAAAERSARVAVARRRLDRRPAGIGQAEQLGGLVERLADRVVHRRAEPLVVADAR